MRSSAAAGRKRTVLLASTLPWEFPARIALGFDALGWRVEAMCAVGQPLRHTRAVRRCHSYPAWGTASAWRRAIAATAPALIVPCDDRALDHLVALHAALPAADPAAALIARSLGDPARTAAMRGRAALLALAARTGVRIPPTLPVPDRAALPGALAAVGPHAVLKADGSWGGAGVEIVDAARPQEALAAYDRLARPPGLVRALKRAAVNRDPHPLPEALLRGRRHVSVQRFIEGRPANCLAACWRGEVLGLVQAAVERTEYALGPSAVIRVIDRPDMRHAAQRVIGALGISGFAGLDFVIEEATGAAYMIEMNQRATPTAHLGLGPGRDPVAALAAAVAGAGPEAREPLTGRDLIAFFPMAWHAAPDGALLRQAYFDVPWSDRGLAEELIRPPLEERGLLARLIDWRLRGRARPIDPEPLAAALAALFADRERSRAPQDARPTPVLEPVP
ncbi:MAG: ATP-grasp domain-containing protein [Proteobacteria bacterium]|nr:ATP-grasp domain-containing protein [Pseudomonadota bacterium]